MKSLLRTTGRKIICGYAVVLIVFIAVTAVANRAVKQAGKDLGSYSVTTHENDLAAELEASMIRLQLATTSWLNDPTDTAAKAQATARQNLESVFERGRKEVVDAKRAADLEQAASAANSYNAAFAELVSLQQQRVNTVEADVDKPAKALVGGINNLIDSARASGDQNASTKSGNALQSYYEAAAAANSFLLKPSTEQATAVRTATQRLQTQLAGLARDLEQAKEFDASLADPVKEALLKELSAQATAYAAGFEKIVALTSERAKVVSEKLDRYAPEVAKNVDDVRKAVADAQQDLESTVSSTQSRDEFLVMSLTFVGLGLAIAAAWVITHTVNRSIFGLATKLTSSAESVASSSSQVSTASQSLADGSSRQAASLEETSASLEEMAGMTRRTAEHASRAEALAGQTRSAADSGTRDVEALQKAMEAIQNSSAEISKIIKTIDKIALQTDILALNAAVEAARAGDAGLGFAVVAEEVRTLAHNAAQAARETTERISEATQRSEQGAEISAQVARRLAEITTKAHEFDSLVAEISTAAREQNQGIEQVTRAVAEMDSVTQSNAATAEETASAAVDMTEQSAVLQNIIADLNQMIGAAANQSVTAKKSPIVSPLTSSRAATAAGTPRRQPQRRAHPTAAAKAHQGLVTPVAHGNGASAVNADDFFKDDHAEATQGFGDNFN